MSITWNYYSGRAGVSLKRFLKENKKIKSYEDLCASLLARGVDVPPTEKEYLDLQPPPKKRVATDMFKPKPKTVNRRSPSKKQALGIKTKTKRVKKDATEKDD